MYEKFLLDDLRYRMVEHRLCFYSVRRPITNERVTKIWNSIQAPEQVSEVSMRYKVLP